MYAFLQNKNQHVWEFVTYLPFILEWEMEFILKAVFFSLGLIDAFSAKSLALPNVCLDIDHDLHCWQFSQ